VTRKAREWQQWISKRPKVIRDLAKRVPPDYIYRIKATRQECAIVSYYEDGTLKVWVNSWFPVFVPDEPAQFGYEVFGYKPEDLEQLRRCVQTSAKGGSA